LIIRDLGSRNGTVVNGKFLCNTQGPLAHGQIVKFGAIEARLEIPRRATTSDTVTDVTAVHFHAHKPPAQPSAPNPATILDAGPSPTADDHTLVLPRPSAPPATTSTSSAPLPARANHVWRYVLAAVLALIALLWWRWH
jgi:pSer/pThr/pTyr-binding forkhead associated (FHA) protein